MANVHGLNEFGDAPGNANNGDGSRRQGMSGMFNSSFGQGGMFGGDEDTGVDPRKETFFQMLKINLCPTLKFFSFCTLMAIGLTVIYIIELAVDGVNWKGQFLEINHERVFIPY